MLELDVRTTTISSASLYLALGAARLLSRRAYGSVPGYWAWLASDILVGVSLLCVGLRYTLLSERASILGACVLSVGGFELRDLGVRRFLGLSRVPLASLLPDGIASTALLALVALGAPQRTQNARVILLFGLLAYIASRTAWPLLRRDVGRLTRDARVLGIVGVLAAASLAALGIWRAAIPLTADWTAPRNWPTGAFYVFSNLFVAAWSLLSFVLTASWVELRREVVLEAKRKSDERFRLLLEESPIPTVVLSPDGWIRYANRKFVEATGYPLDDIRDEDRWWTLTCPEPEHRAAARRAWHEAVDVAGTREREGPAPELVLDFRNGPGRNLELHARRVGDEVVLQLVDTSLLKAAMQAREEIIAVVSHDLKSPLTAILLRVEALLRRHADPLVDTAAQAIHQSASSMESLIGDLLDMQSLDAGRLRLDLAPTDLAALIRSVVEIVSPLASRRSTRIACEMAPLGDVACDEDRVARVLANLVGNAIKFTQGGTITIRGEERSDGVLISVADTGSGIAPDVLPHVFDRYFTTARGQKGTGLGLYIARGIVAAHGGRIWATSAPGKGTTFSFTLPRSHEQPGCGMASPR